MHIRTARSRLPRSTPRTQRNQHWSQQDSQDQGMANHSKVCQRGQEHIGNPRIPTPLHPRLRRYCEATHKPSKENHNFWLDPCLYHGPCHPPWHHHLWTRPSTPRSGTPVYTGSWHLSVHDRGNFILGRQNHDGSERQTDPLTMWIPLPNILHHQATIPDLWPRILGCHPWTKTLGLPSEVCKIPHPCHHGSCQPHVLPPSPQNRPVHCWIYQRIQTV